ncbi:MULTISPECIES: NUDIX domain-containing protein [Haematobacter]|uniref:NUDIX hydrolase n=1 Tax=Haematobacter genomosp. 1 TaxID=366618 RepID=A0A212A662_9RHOB|nr:MULTISPECIES: NUDIX hydrolase [Haematobacter]OWJ74345.1 NUDIX hydrolase [Haematobacter genomosp. 1]
MIRRIGEPVRADRRYRLRPGAYAMLVLGDSLLMTFQAEPTPELQLPGGGVDPGESPVRALHREVMEETGWTIAAPRRVGAYRRFTYMPEYDRWAEKLCAIYIARPVLRRGEPTEPGHTALWLPVADAPEMAANEGERLFLEQLAAGLIPPP